MGLISRVSSRTYRSFDHTFFETCEKNFTKTTMKLAAFLMKMNNNTVTIELKNGSSVQGTIQGADMMMNIHMTNVTLKTKKLRDGDSIKLEKFTVRGNTIRYVILPSDVNLSQKIDETEQEALKRKHNPGTKEDTERKAAMNRGRGSSRGGGRGRGRGRGGRGGPRGGGRGRF